MRSEEKAMQKQLIRVAYPTDGGKIALRTEADCDANIEPDSVQPTGCISEFQIETGRPYFYFKPVLRRAGTTMRSRGANCLATATSGAPLAVHSFFAHA